MDRSEPLDRVLRLLCLHSLVHHGVKDRKQFESIKRGIIHTCASSSTMFKKPVEEDQIELFKFVTEPHKSCSPASPELTFRATFATPLAGLHVQ